MTVNHWVAGSSPAPGAMNTADCDARHSSIAQSVEQVTVNHWVAGSSPARGAISSFDKEPSAYLKKSHQLTPYSRIAQSVEQVTVNHWVAGSSPAPGAISLCNSFRALFHIPRAISYSTR